MKRLLFSLVLLSACQGTNLPGGPSTQPSPQPSASVNNGAQTGTGLFANALSKRSLSLDAFGQSAESAADGNNATGSAPAAAPAPTAGAVSPGRNAAAQDAIAPGFPGGDAGRLSMPGYGWNSFDQVVLQFAEESIFPASKAQSLMSAYTQTAQPLMQEWDSTARLSESQAYLGQLNPQQSYYLPDENGKPSQVKLNYLYRWTSDKRKESLIVYLTDTETRVHRMVWGEPNLDFSKVSLDSDAAQNKAKAALESTASNPGYPVYPDQAYPDQEIVTQIPADAQWQIQLNQNQGQNSRYFISVNFMTNSANAGERYASGFVEIDAVSGAILNLNRPLLYTGKMDVGSVEPAQAVMPPKALR